MKPDSSKEGMKADTSNRKYPHVEPVSSQEHTMDSASDCQFVYSTPQVGKTDNDIQGSVSLTVRSSYSVDSGISDTFNSTWASSINDVSSLSAECSPQPQPGSKRQALKACECSPIKRVSSACIQGRRLTFTEADFQAVELSALERNASESQNFCEKSVKSEELDELTVRQTDTLPVLPSVEGYYQAQSCFSSPDSAIGDSLEISIQEMALRDFSLDIDCTPLNFKSTKCDNGEQLRICHKEKHELYRDSRTFPKGCICPHFTSDSFRDKSVGRISRSQSSQTETPLKYSPYCTYRQPRSSDIFHTEAFHQRTDVQLKFQNKLSLAPASQQTDHKLQDAASEQGLPNLAGSEHSIAAAQSLLDRISPDVELIHTCANLRGSHPCQQHTLPWSIADLPDCCASTVKCHSDNNKGLTLSQSQTLNPSKRSSDCTQACYFPFGPPKVRRTHMLVNEGKASVRQIPGTCTSGKVLDKTDGFASDCGTLKVDLQLYNSPSLHFADQRPIEEDKSSCDIQLQKSDSHLFHSFYGKYNQATERESAVDNFSGEHVNRCLQKLCPRGPAHLIGRNVGIGKFDIVYELCQQNFYLCLEAIFSHLADCDLASLVAVSTTWKLALYSEHKAYTRYRQHKRSLSVRNIQHVSGKENTTEKPSSAPSSQTLTQPRGLLCSIQSQAETKAAPEPAPAVVPTDVLMCDDTLRACPHCQGPAMVKPCQDRATCMSNKCAYDFCTLCFTAFHHPRPCKPLCKAPSRAEVAGTKKSKKNLKRL